MRLRVSNTLRAATLSGFAGFAVVVSACGSGDDHPPPLSGVGTGGTGGSLSGSGGDECQGPPKPSTSNLCGNEVVPVVQEKPNIYFVLDSSGSMSFEMESGATRLAASKSAMTNLLHELGHRINYGLATYPGFGVDECSTGAEVFATKEGDPVQCVNKRVAGPVLTSFAKKLSAVVALGGTPTAATLEAILPTVTALEGQTFVVLLTDGAPNCSLEAHCGVDECMPNIEGQLNPDGIACTPDFNCCDPEQTNRALAQINCVDRDDSIAAVEALAAAGVKTYVIGVPGSEYYADLLDQLATAGGTAREGEKTLYYSVSDSQTLSTVLKTIGTSVATSCDITLQHGSNIDPTTINVYFDATLIPSSTDNGWTFESPTISLHGDACDQVLNGEVVQVQVVAGCPTVIR